MTCEPINSFAATALSEFKYHDSNDSLVTIEIDIDMPLDSSDEIHRKLIRHLYRRIGYGASWADIENATVTQDDIDNGTQADKTLGKLVDRLIDNHLNDYQRDDNGNILNPENPTIVTNGARHIFEDEKFDWVNRDITLKKIEDDGDIVNALPPTRQNELISNYLTNESIIGGSNSVRAKLMQFWQNHFVIEERHPVAGRPAYLLRYFKVLFNNAFGNFRTFVEEIGRTPAMLAYLNGYLNICNPGDDGSRTPDENYARELLELFTMGEKYHGQFNYDEDADVRNLARALSGWTFDALSPLEGELRFRYALHDWTRKTFVGGTIEGGITPGDSTIPIDASSPYWEMVFGPNSVPPGEETLPYNYTTFEYDKGTVIGTPLDEVPVPLYNIDQTTNYYTPYPNDANAERAFLTAAHLEYKAIHNIIFDNRENAIAYFICRKLYEFYIYGDVEGLNKKMRGDVLSASDLTELDDFIESLATTFKDNNWEIVPVLKHLFKSQHFYDAGIIGAQIKSPVECGTSIFRAANLKGGWWIGATSEVYDYKYKLQLTQPGTDYPTATSTSHINYYGGIINHITGEGIDTQVNIGGGTEYENQYIVHAYRSLQDTDTWKLMYQHWGRIGQPLFNPPDVAGWLGHQSWLNEFTWMKRREMMYYFIQERFMNTSAIDKLISLVIDLANLPIININQYGYEFDDEVTPSDGVQLVWKIWRHFFAVEPTERQIKDAVAAYLETHTYTNFPYPIAGDDESKGRIRDLLVYFIQQPEYQLN